MEKLSDITGAYKIKKSGKDHDLTSKFFGSFLEDFEDLYSLEKTKGTKYFIKTTSKSKFLVVFMIISCLTRSITKRVQVMLFCIEKKSESCTDSVLKCTFVLLFIA